MSATVPERFGPSATGSAGVRFFFAPRFEGDLFASATRGELADGTRGYNCSRRFERSLVAAALYVEVDEQGENPAPRRVPHRRRERPRHHARADLAPMDEPDPRG